MLSLYKDKKRVEK